MNDIAAIDTRFRRMLATTDRGLEPDGDEVVAIGRYARMLELTIEPEWLPPADSNVVCALVARPRGPAGAVALLAIEHVASPLGRSRSHGAQIIDLEFGRFPESFREVDVVFAVYHVPPTLMGQRILEDCQRLLPAIDHDVDIEGSRLVAEAVFDRLDGLAALPGFRCLVSASALAISLAHRRRLRAPGAIIELGTGVSPTGYQAVLERLRPERHRSAERLTASYAGGATESYADRVQRLRKTRDLAVRFGQRAFERTFSRPPLAVHLATNLASEFATTIRDRLDMMRDGLYYELGFFCPAISVPLTGDPALASNSYAIQLWGLPLVGGTVNLDRVLVNETVDRLRLLHIDGEETVNPANGSECAWISVSSKAIAEAAGLTTWTALEYVVLHLTSVVRKNCAAITTLDSAGQLLGAASQELDRRVRSAPGGIARFTTVLRLLLDEEAPVRVLRPLAEQYLVLVTAGKRTDEIVEELRSGEAVRPHLRAAKPGTPIWRLGPRLIEQIRAGVDKRGGGRVLALEPDVTQEMLTAIRNQVTALPPTAANPVIMVDDGRLRAHVRRLVELEFPHLAVISRRELHEPDGSQTIAVIEIGEKAP